MSFFKSSDVQKFIEIVSEMAPQAGLSTSKTKSQ
jgi:hypothetical protein